MTMKDKKQDRQLKEFENEIKQLKEQLLQKQSETLHQDRQVQDMQDEYDQNLRQKS